MSQPYADRWNEHQHGTEWRGHIALLTEVGIGELGLNAVLAKASAQRERHESKVMDGARAKAKGDPEETAQLLGVRRDEQLLETLVQAAAEAEESQEAESSNPRIERWLVSAVRTLAQIFRENKRTKPHVAKSVYDTLRAAGHADIVGPVVTLGMICDMLPKGG